MRLIKRPVDASIMAFVALGLFLIPVKFANAAAGVNDNSAFLQVYVNNVENLTGPDVTPSECRAQYTDLIEYIKTQRYVPDVFIVQQVNNAAHAEDYAIELQEAFGGLPLKPEYDYDFVIADEFPAEFKPNDPNSCLTNNLKNYQTNAIFYRSDRLSPTGIEGRWRSSNGVNNRTKCKRNKHARTENVTAQFYDTKAGKTVSVGSVHWPNTSTATEDETAICNINKTVDEMNTTPSDLIIFGGDMNHDDVHQPVGNTDWMTWYAKANGELSPGVHGYTDPIYSLCSDATPPRTLQQIVACSHDNGTLNKSFITDPPKKRRIDFLFADWPSSSDKVLTSDQHTITPDEANQAAGNSDVDYSDHRAIRARVHYDVPAVNYPPTFTSDPILKPDATVGAVYSGSSLLGDASDPNDDPLSFSKISGPAWLSVGEYDGALSGAPACEDLGPNSFNVRVSDGAAHDEATLNILVTEAAGGPAISVDAGADQIITLPASQVSLSGSVTQTTNCSGAPGYTVEWSSNPVSDVTFSNAESAITTAIFSAPDTYVLRLTATDALDNSDYDELTVTVNPEPASDPVVLEQSTRSGSVIFVRNTQNASQSFRHITPDGTPYRVTKVTVYLSRQSKAPNASLEFNIDTAIQGPGLNGSQVSISADSLTTKKKPYDITFAGPIQLSSGDTYYLNFNSVATNKKYYVQTSEEATAYRDGKLYRTGKKQSRDARFTITGTE